MHCIPQIVPSGPPTMVEAKSESSTSIRLSWQPPLQKDRNGIIDYYSISINMLTNLTLNETSYLASNLLKFHEYQFSISAHNEKGFGPAFKITERTKEDGKLVLLIYCDDWLV